MNALSSVWRRDAIDVAAAADARRSSALAGVLRRIYRVTRLRNLVTRLCLRLEGGAIYSQTLRDLLRDVHGVRVGRYSYGSVLVPGLLPKGTEVGNYCSVGAELIVRRRDHPIERPILHPFFYNSALGLLKADTIKTDDQNPLTIGHDVWIGDRVCILSGCQSIGNGAVIAAGSVVTKDVAPYTIVGGVPARILKERFDAGQMAALEESLWWEMPIAALLQDPPQAVKPSLL